MKWMKKAAAAQVGQLPHSRHERDQPKMSAAEARPQDRQALRDGRLVESSSPRSGGATGGSCVQRET